MQFKRRGWQYPEPDGVVTMPGNARQAFPAKRGAEKGDNRTIRYAGLLHICFYAILLLAAARYSRDITQSRFIRHPRWWASLYLIRSIRWYHSRRWERENAVVAFVNRGMKPGDLHVLSYLEVGSNRDVLSDSEKVGKI